MTQVVIIEDEVPARKKLNRFLSQLDEEVTVAAEFETVPEALRFGSPVGIMLQQLNV